VAAPEKLAATVQYRQPGRVAPPSSELPQGNRPAFGAYLSTRLWSETPSNHSSNSFDQSNSSAVSLTVDLLKASEGVAGESKGNILITGFATTQSAIAAARRLQWAVQGFCEAEGKQNTSVAVFIESAPEGSDKKASPLIDRIAPGQILLSERAWRSFEGLPGLPLQGTSDAATRELLWRQPDDQTTPDFDEHVYANLLAAQGLAYRPPEEFKAESDTAPPVPEEKTESVFNEALPGRLLQFVRGNQRLVIGGASVAAIVFVALTIFHSAGKKSATTVPKPADTQLTNPVSSGGSSAGAPAGPASGPSEGAPPVASGPSGTSKADRNKHQQAMNPGATPQKGQKGAGVPGVNTVRVDESQNHVAQPISVPQAPRQDAHASKCDMSQSEISGTLDLAERSFERAKYDAAERQFRTVLSCEPSNVRAREGLDKVHSAKESEN